MNRRDFLTRMGFGAAAIGVGSLSERALAEAPATQPTTAPSIELSVAPPVLTNLQGDGVTVLCAVSAPSTAWIEIGTSPDKLDRKIGAIQQGLWSYDPSVQRIRITGLSPGTTYHYRVCVCGIAFKNAYAIKRTQTVNTETFSFRTLSTTNSAVTFGVINDTHEVRNTMATLSKRIHEAPLDFTVWNGDMFNDIHADDQAAMQLLKFNNQPFASTSPYVYVRGNHDVRGPLARAVPRYSDVPNGQYYYSFRHGPIAFIVLDTGEDKPDDHPVYAGLNDFAAFRTEQAHWLASEVEKPHIKEAPYRVLLCHIPMRWTDESSKGSWCGDGRSKWHDSLVKARLQLVISGHTHSHTFIPASTEFPYAQLVGGGPQLAAATFIKGQADEKKLTLTMTKATGEAIGTYDFNPG